MMSRIGANCVISPGAWVAPGAVLGRGCVLEAGSAVGEGAVLGDGVTLRRGVRIWPGVEVPEGLTLMCPDPEEGNWCDFALFAPDLSEISAK